MDFLHADVNGHALCDGRELDLTRDADSPECQSIPLCRTCFNLVEHIRRRFAEETASASMTRTLPP